MRKTMMICLVLVLALGLMGAGFAKWSDSVTVNASVNTGTVKVGILDAGVFDIDADPNQAPGDNSEEKNVASTTSTNGAAKCLVGGVQYYDSITETFTNVYPWYKTGSTIKIGSAGTIPVKIESIEQLTASDPEGIAPYIKLATGTTGDVTKITLPNGSFLYPTSWDDLVTKLRGIQIHKDQVVIVDLWLYFAEELTQGGPTLPQGATASVSYKVTASQWNEVP